MAKQKTYELPDGRKARLDIPERTFFSITDFFTNYLQQIGTFSGYVLCEMDEDWEDVDCTDKSWAKRVGKNTVSV